MSQEVLQLRVHGDASLPTLVYLPGLHGDWTLIASFRNAIAGKARFVEFTYPRTLAWSLTDYAKAIDEALRGQGITKGWVLGESFGSQIAWELIDLQFEVQGIVLAGGFAQHPVMAGVRFSRWAMHRMPLRWLRGFLFFYAKYARFRHRHAPETMDGVNEFIARRTELDKKAMTHRLMLIAGNNACAKAKAAKIPVYHLAGFFDPVVPWFWAQHWLKRHCAAWRGHKVIFNADHNVLGTAPRESAEEILTWMNPAVTPLPASQNSPR